MKFPIILLMLTTQAKATDCGVQLSKLSRPIQQSSTEGLVSYLSRLLEQQVIGTNEIQVFHRTLSAGQLVNPMDDKRASVNSPSLVHGGEIQRYFDTGKIDIKQLLEWATKKLQDKIREKAVREVTKNESSEIYQKIHFHPLPAGKFKIEEIGVELTHPFEMMSTPVTQRQWVDVMGENPSFNKSGPDLITLDKNGKRVLLLPDHPVENLTWFAAISFANRLSERAGLKPTYDLSKINTENGLMISPSHAVLVEGSIYETEGYRLPTEAEFEYVLRQGGRITTKDPLKDLDVDRYAWFFPRSESTQAVAQFEPIVANGHKFFDLIGNVWEWTNDFWEPHFTGGRNPHGPSQGWNRVILGGSYNEGKTFPIIRESQDIGGFSRTVGFRLVRTLK